MLKEHILSPHCYSDSRLAMNYVQWNTMCRNVRDETANAHVPKNRSPSAQNGYYLTARAQAPLEKEPKSSELEAFLEVGQ